MCFRSAAALIPLLSLTILTPSAINRPLKSYSRFSTDSTLRSAPQPAPHFRRANSNTLDSTRRLGELPLAFEENRGQAQARVKFLTRGNGYVAFLTPTDVVLSLSEDRRQRSTGLNISEKPPSAI